MKTKIIAMLLGLALWVAPGFASTITVTVDGNDYTLTTIVGSFEDNASLLTGQVWWNDETLANKLISEVQGGLGYPHVGSGNLSPWMAIDARFPSGSIYTGMWSESGNSMLHLAVPPSSTHFPGSSTPSPITWIVADTTPVPEAGATLGYVVLAMGVLLFRRKTVRSAA